MLSKFSMVTMVIAVSMFSTSVFAAGDTGKITMLYSHLSGAMAVQLDIGLPGANAVGNCGVQGNVWAGVSATAPASIKAALLSAKMTGTPVTLVTFGNCVNNWIQIEALQM